MVAMAEADSFSLTRWLVRRRLWVQAAFLLVWLDPFMLRMHNVCGPVFHCYSCPLASVACPIGVLANFTALHLIPFMAIGILVIVGAFAGTAVCGWACPFGLLQDLIGSIPAPKFKLPARAGYLRYAVLVGLVLAIPYLYGQEHPLFFCRLCPAGAIEGAIPNTVRTAMAGGGIVLPGVAKVTILIVILVAMLFVLRPWCMLFCPLGAIFSLFNRASMLVLRFHGDQCDQCGACDKLCKYGVLPAVDVNNADCVRCLECTRCKAISLGSVFARRATAGSDPKGPGQARRPSASAG